MPDVAPAGHARPEPPALVPSPRDALLLLKEGNARFASGKCQHPNLTGERMRETARRGQQPFATILACSDSRCPVERLFDRGVGDLFVVRVAGGVCNADEIASIEFAVIHVATPLLVVLGHTRCAAVSAVVAGTSLPESMAPVVSKVRAAMAAAQRSFSHLRGDDLVPEAVKANVWQSLGDLFRGSSAVRQRVGAGKLVAIGALYHIDSGKVEWLGPHPDQARLLA